MEGPERILTFVSYVAALAVVVGAGLTTGFSGHEPTALQVIIIVVLAGPAVFLFTFSLFGIVSYFLFIPSIAEDGHLFARVHATNLLHPLSTALVLGLAALCVFTESLPPFRLCRRTASFISGTDPGLSQSAGRL